MRTSYVLIVTVFVCLCARAQPATAESKHTLAIHGTRFTLNGQPFQYTGLSFFNALYNTNFNASSAARTAWLAKFQSYGINVLRIWCQWDNARGFADAAPANTMYRPGGSLHPPHLQTLKGILTDADKLGLCVELVFFSQESSRENIRIRPPDDETAVTTLTRELLPWRNLTFQIWNEHSDSRVLPLVKAIKAIDPQRLVSNSPGGSSALGSEEENRALDYLTPHTARQGSGRHWEIAPQQLAGLLKKFEKPVVDDEPARTGTPQFGGPREMTSPYDHIVQILAVWRIGAYPTYHHDMFQTGYGSPTVPPSGVPDPEFSPYHRQVFNFLKLREKYVEASK